VFNNPPVILSPSLPVILSVAKNLTPLRTGSAKNLETLSLHGVYPEQDSEFILSETKELKFLHFVQDSLCSLRMTKSEGFRVQGDS